MKSWHHALVVLNVLACISVIALAGKFLVIPMVGEHLLSAEYKKLVFRCDHAMREHMISKNKFLLEPTDGHDAELRAAEFGLLQCHEYDVLRKRMLDMGVSEHTLSAVALEAIEEQSEDVREVVRIHEFRY
jgi:hypothetical protein